MARTFSLNRPAESLRTLASVNRRAAGAWAALSGGGGGGGGVGLISSMPTPPNIGSIYAGTTGWAFDVGATALTAKGLRVFHPGAVTKPLRLWDSAGALLAEVTPTTIADTWVEALFSSDVLLTAGARYTVGFVQEGVNRYQFSTVNGVYHSGITMVGGRFGTSTTAMPTGADNATIYGIVDLLVAA